MRRIKGGEELRMSSLVLAERSLSLSLSRHKNRYRVLRPALLSRDAQPYQRRRNEHRDHCRPPRTVRVNRVRLYSSTRTYPELSATKLPYLASFGPLVTPTSFNPLILVILAI